MPVLLFLLLAAGLLMRVCVPDAPPVRARGPVTIVYWEKWTNFEGDAVKKVVDGFNRSQDRIHVRLVTVSSIEKKLLVATAGGDPPDISGLYSRNVQVYADKGALQSLDGGMARYHIHPDDFIPIYLKECRLRGSYYALPIAGMTLGLHYNKDQFRQAGIPHPPRTLRELEEDADKLTLYNQDGSLKRLGFLPTDPGWWNWSWIYYLGGDLYDYQTHRITADTPQNIRALQWFADYSAKYGVDRLTQFEGGIGSFASPQNAFLDGKVSMEIQGVWMYAFIQAFNPKLHWGVVPFPAFSKKVHDVTLTESDVLVIPTGSPHPRQAMEFLAYMTGMKAQEQLNLLQMKFPMLKKVPARFWKESRNPYLAVYRKLADSPCAFTAPRMGIFAQYFDGANTAFDQVWLHQKTPEEALRELQDRMQKQWKRELRRLKRRGLSPGD
jgi:multiple sugar transport system substrate-binding protein